MQFSVLILFSFHWENSSTINSFHTVAPNSLKPSQCTPTTHWELSEDTKSTAWSLVVREISVWQNKTRCHTNTLVLLIDKMLYMCIMYVYKYIYCSVIYLYVSSHKMISIVTTICLDFGPWLLFLSLPFLGAFFS